MDLMYNTNGYIHDLGHFVLVDPSIGTTSEKVGGEIIFVYFPQHIKQLEQAGQW